MGAKRILSTLAIGAMLAASLPAQALERLFPPNIKRGTLSNVDFPSVSVNGSQRKLALALPQGTPGTGLGAPAQHPVAQPHKGDQQEQLAEQGSGRLPPRRRDHHRQRRGFAPLAAA